MTAVSKTFGHVAIDCEIPKNGGDAKCCGASYAQRGNGRCDDVERAGAFSLAATNLNPADRK
jgi:hypothetical protein